MTLSPSSAIWTDRLRLDPFTSDDEDVLLAMFRDEGVRRYLLDGKLVERDWVRTEIHDSVCRFADGGLGIFLARNRRTGAPIGFTGYRPFREPPVLELLYGLYPAFWRQGLATEMARAMLTLAFDGHGLEAVETAVDGPNVASIRVLERLGFSEFDRSPGAFGVTLHFRLARPGAASDPTRR
jgi:ribosomal-protein-alanine N-acetyltransferase